MAFSIPGVATATVFAQAPRSFSGVAGNVRLEIKPSQSLIHTGTGTPLEDFNETITPGEGGTAEIELPLTDQPGFQDDSGQSVTGWHYVARIHYEMPGRREGRVTPAKSFHLPAGQSLVDLAILPNITPAVAVTSTNLDGGNASTTYGNTNYDGGTANG